jgi:septum formation protein
MTSVLATDTIVCLDEEVLLKPGSALEPAATLRARLIADVSETTVWFGPISEDEIAAYVATGEPVDQAGAYTIQGYGSRFARRMEGCYHNVVGFPVSLVYRHLKSL